LRGTVVVGDLHGRLARLEQILRTHGEDAEYLFVGDLTDRHHEPEDAGYRVIRRVMGLPNARALLGNHDVLLLGVLDEALGPPRREPLSARFRTLAELWLYNGGHWADLQALAGDADAVDWLRSLDAVALVGEALVQHSDSPVYLEYGSSVAEINAGVREAARRDPHRTFAQLLQRLGFLENRRRVGPSLRAFGARRLVHGHTPHGGEAPLVYAGRRCVDVDGQVHVGGAVFVIPAVAEAIPA
jgi:hypothetical protein